MPESSDSAEAAVEILEATDVDWALAGALAAATYRLTQRHTVDADFLVRGHEALVAAFARAGYDVRQIADPDEPPHLVLVRGFGHAIDLLVASVPYQHLALDRAIGHVLTIEDVIVHKLIAWRPRDQGDIASILSAGHQMDDAYIEEWAREWEVLDRWREISER